MDMLFLAHLVQQVLSHLLKCSDGYLWT